MRFPDEEPDVGEPGTPESDDNWFWAVEEQFASGCCERCGIEGHPGEKCPTVTPLLLRGDR